MVFVLLSSTASIMARPPITIEYVSISTASVQGNHDSFLGHISHDGRYVAFFSRANNLSPADPNQFADLYLRDRLAGTTTHIAPVQITSTIYPLHRPEISGDGNWIVFETFASLDAADTNGTEDTYLYNIITGAFQLISSGTGSANSGNPSVSYSSCYVVYDTDANDVYLYDRSTNTRSLLASGAIDPHISADGNFIVYTSFSGRTLYLYNRVSGTATAIDSQAIAPMISADSSLIVYSRGNSPRLIMAYNRLTNTYTTLTVTSTSQNSFEPAVTADGSWVVFSSFADDLVPGPDSVSMDIFAYEMATSSIERLSYLTTGVEPNDRTDIPIISGNGQLVLFQSDATDHIVPDTNGGYSDVFVANYGLVGTPIGTPTDGTCTPQIPIYASVPAPGSTITITGASGTTQNATLAISNTGTPGSLLDVTPVGTLTNFGITTPPTGLTPAASPTNVNVSCTVPALAPYTETLTVQTNEAGSPQYSYTLQCISNLTPQVTIGDVTVMESAGVAQFMISLNIPLGSALTLDISSSDNSAIAGSDYTTIPPGTQVTIIAGSTSTTYDVPILDDSNVEPDETFAVTISNPSIGGVAIARADGVGTITNDDVPPVPTVSGPAPNEDTPPNMTLFDPAISKLGFLLPGQVGVIGEQIEWVVTVSNPGTVTGHTVTITDVIDDRLEINNVVAPGASVSISGQTITVTYPVLNGGESVQYSIFTTVLDGVQVTNTACVIGANQTGERCATGSVVGELPSTGEQPAVGPES